jgi:PadR family transcriptional regulator, regulatory protein AphA
MGMSIEHAILGLLSIYTLSGYDIKKMFAGSVALNWSGNNNQIYKTLLKLHEQGLVNCEIQIQETSPARKLYSITDQGVEELRKWVLADPQIPQVRNSFLIQLAWADLLTTAELDNLLERYESELRMQVAMLSFQKQNKNISPSGVARDSYINILMARTPRETFLWNKVLENWMTFYQAELSWVSEMRSEAGKF